jgi:hypothetical protein
MARGGHQLVDHPRVDRCPVCGDLKWRWSSLRRAGDECPRGGAVSPFGRGDVNDLTVLVNRPVQVRPAAGDLDLGFVDEPSTVRRMACQTRGVDELRG